MIDIENKDKKEEKKRTWRFSIKNDEEKNDVDINKGDKYIVKTENNISQEKNIRNKYKDNKNDRNNENQIIKENIIIDKNIEIKVQDKNNINMNINQKQLTKDNTMSQSTEKIIFNKHRDNNAEIKNKKEKEMIKSKSYKDIKVNEIKTKKKEEHKKTWRFGIKDKEEKTINNENINILEYNDKISEIKEIGIKRNYTQDKSIKVEKEKDNLNKDKITEHHINKNEITKNNINQLEVKKEPIKQWGFSVRNKYEQDNKQISKSENKNIEKKLTVNEDNKKDSQIEEKNAINISSKQKYEKDKRNKLGEEKIESHKKEKIINNEYDSNIKIVKNKDTNNKTKKIEIKNDFEQIDNIDNIPKNKDIQKTQKNDKQNTSLRQRLFSTEEKKNKKDYMITTKINKPQEINSKSLTKTKSEYNFNNKNISNITEIVPENKEIKNEENKKEKITKRYEKKEVKRIPHLNKDNFIEQKNKISINKNNKEEKNEAIGKKVEVQKKIEKEDFVENKGQKYELKNQEKNKKNKYQFNIKRNSFEDNKINEYNKKIAKTEIQDKRIKPNISKNKEIVNFERESKNSKEDSFIRKNESQKIATRTEQTKKEKESKINVQKKSIINKSPKNKTNNVLNLNDSNMKKEELAQNKDSIEIKKVKKIKNYTTDIPGIKSKTKKIPIIEEQNKEKEKSEIIKTEKKEKGKKVINKKIIGEKTREERLEQEEFEIEKENEKFKKKMLLEKVNLSKGILKDNLNNKYKTKIKKENIIMAQKSNDKIIETETNLQNRESNQKIINMKKSIFSTNSSDNLSTYKNNNYQRQYSQESNSKLSSSTSGKDKIYKSVRYSKIRNSLRQNQSSSLLTKSFKNKEISVKTESKESKDLINIIEQEKINNEDITNIKRKSELYKFKPKKQYYEEEPEFNDNISNKKEKNNKETNINKNKHEKFLSQTKTTDSENISTKKETFKKSLKINTEEELEEEESNETDKNNLNNLISEENIKKMKFIQKTQNINDILQIDKNLPLKIKIFKCVVYKNTDPNLNEEIIKDILHKRNKSQGRNESFILKLPQGFFTEENNEIKNEENKKYNIERKGKKFYKSKLRASLSSDLFN